MVTADFDTPVVNGKPVNGTPVNGKSIDRTSNARRDERRTESRFARCAVLAALTLGALVANAAAQGKKQLADEEYRDQRWGFAITPFDKWSLIPAQPDERYLIVKFEAPMPATDGKTGDSFRVRMEIFRFDKEGRSVALMDQGKENEKGDGPKTGDDGGVNIKDLEDKTAFKSYEQFINKAYSGVQVQGKPTPLKIGKLDATLHLWQGVYTSSKFKQRAYTVVYSHPDDKSQIAVQYTMPDFKFDEWKDWFKRSSETFKFIKKINNDPKRFDGLTPIEADRLRHKEDCERTGWNFAETPHFFIKYNIDKADFIRDLKERVEAIRAEFVKYYSDKEMTEIPVLRVTKSLDEYYKYGGPPGTGGFWSSGTKELVVPILKDIDMKITWGIMNHEAFHQFIYYRCGEISPHSWYNEGTGDYYFGHRYKGNGTFELKPLGAWASLGNRLDPIQEGIKKGKYVPLEKFLRYSQQQNYAEELGYPEGWSFVYFLRQGKREKHTPWKAEWDQILPEYERVLFETKDANKAIENALRDIKGDKMKALEESWKSYVMKLN